MLNIFKNTPIPFFLGLPHNESKKEIPYPIQQRVLINIIVPRGQSILYVVSMPIGFSKQGGPLIPKFRAEGTRVYQMLHHFLIVTTKETKGRTNKSPNEKVGPK
jgi:hypothetical protein